MMDDIESEDLIASVKEIVYEFQEEITPYAYQLCQHLSLLFKKLTVKYLTSESESSSKDNDNEPLEEDNKIAPA